MLAQATFTGETSTGWQTVYFSNPVLIDPNTTYVAAYFSSLGNYTGTSLYFTAPEINGPLTGLADGTDGPNGVYKYSLTPAFPNSSPAGVAPNYWVDVFFSAGSTPLPVQYLNFSASRENENVKLQWTTANEQNNKGFEIQRSSDRSNWKVIGFVTGVGNSQTSVDYQYTDLNLPSGTYYYRLRQIDFDGIAQLSKVIQVSFTENLALELKQNHPNPFNSGTTIDMVIPRSGRVSLMLYDPTGRPVQLLMDEYKSPGTYHVQVNRNGLSAGVYYYNLNALGQSLVRKMIIY